LIVEDNFVVAMQAKRLLQDVGIAQVDVVSSVSECLSLIAAYSYDFCLLDMNLQGELCTPVAQLLEQQRIPYAIATGVGVGDRDALSGLRAEIISKPIAPTKLVAAMHDALASNK